MFLRKLDALAQEWGKQENEMEEIRKESLLYAMRLKTTPTGLKNALRKNKVDPKVATPLWSGNAYLLLTLPEVLTNPKSKIPCLEDFLYAKAMLQKEQIGTLRKKINRIPETIDREKLILRMQGLVKNKAKRARFISMLDPSVERADLQQDMTVEFLKIVNKEITNLKTSDPGKIQGYLMSCLDQKSKTYVRKHKPRQFRVDLEQDSDMERLLHEEHAPDNTIGKHLADPLVQRDLKDLLTWEQAEAVWLLFGIPGADHDVEFSRFLSEQGVSRNELPAGKLKRHIQKFLDAPEVFDEIREHTGLRTYFREL